MKDRLMIAGSGRGRRVGQRWEHERGPVMMALSWILTVVKTYMRRKVAQN